MSSQAPTIEEVEARTRTAIEISNFLKDVRNRSLKLDKARDSFAKDGVPLAEIMLSQAQNIQASNTRNDPDYSAVGNPFNCSDLAY